MPFIGKIVNHKLSHRNLFHNNPTGILNQYPSLTSMLRRRDMLSVDN